MVPVAVPPGVARRNEFKGATPEDGLAVKLAVRVGAAETVIVVLASGGVTPPRSTITLPVYVPAGVYELLLVVWVVTLTALHLYPTALAEHVPTAGAGNVPHEAVTVATLFEVLEQFHQ